MDAYLRYAEHAPFHDPGPLVAIMAAATRRIGLAATLSTTFYPPFLLARLMTTLDHLSRGRIAWNVVTSYKIEEALNLYEELLDHDQRYDRADEYMDCAIGSGRAGIRTRSSWTSAPTPSPIPRRCPAIDFEGTYYRSRGPLSATAERVAAELARTIDAVGGDGFAIRQGIWPGYVGPFVEKVIPLLQQRGAVRTEYTGTTLREHLREF